MVLYPSRLHYLRNDSSLQPIQINIALYENVLCYFVIISLLSLLRYFFKSTLKIKTLVQNLFEQNLSIKYGFKPFNSQKGTKST